MKKQGYKLIYSEMKKNLCTSIKKQLTMSKYNGIDSFATFNDGSNLKIKRESFSDRW